MTAWSRWWRRLIVVLATAWVVYALAFWAPREANGDVVSATTGTSTVPAAGLAAGPPPEILIDGHGAAWWARRARRNGDRMRAAQAALRRRAGVTLSARHLAGVSTSPDGLLRAFLCIHHFEGSWTDPGSPYFGGVQMDTRFASTYGRAFFRAWGTPDRWPPFVQLTVAMNAYLSGRGFYPWPNTARYCGLLR